MRSTTFKHLAMSAVAALVAALWVVVPVSPASAATITVACDGAYPHLELWQAIVEANDESTHPGPDVLELAQGCTYEPFAPFPGTDYALPPITSAITIIGHSTTIRYLSSTDEAGLFDVAAGAGLSLSHLTLINGEGGTSGAYFHNAGDITVDHTDMGDRTTT